MNVLRLGRRSLCIVLLFSAPSFLHAQLIRSATGVDAASITAARDQYRSDLGGGTSAGANGSFGESAGRLIGTAFLRPFPPQTICPRIFSM